MVLLPPSVPQVGLSSLKTSVSAMEMCIRDSLMTRYFMRDTPLCQMEQQMMTPPYFKPRGHGRYYPGFQYSSCLLYTSQTGKVVWDSYTQIRGGLTQEDYVAFPYGRDVVSGAKTERCV